MKKIFIVLLCVFPLFVFADSLDRNDAFINWKEVRSQIAVADWVIYKQGLTKEDAKKSYNNFKKNADDGHYLSAYFIAYDYFFNKRDYKNSAKYFKVISEKYNGPGDSLLGYMYSDGKGVDKDLDLAIFYYQKHVRSNDELIYRAKAAYSVGATYEKKYENTPSRVLHKDSIEMREHQMGAAWLYVSYWMGNNIGFNKLGSKYSLQNFLNETESKHNEEKVYWVKSQAAEICRTISGCITPKI